MKKIIGIISTIISSLIVLSILLVVFFGVSAFTFSSGKTTAKDYSNIIKENVSGNPLVVDIAMLGAHNAFSNAITTKSTVDPAESKDSRLRNQYLMLISRGLSARMAKGQKSSATDLLKHGVRYFDVRASFYEENWYAKHGYLSDKLETYLLEMIDFLQNNDGEVLVLDFQHVYYGGNNLGTLMDYIRSVKNGMYSVIDFVNYMPSLIPLSTLSYNDVTENGTKSGVVILAKGTMDRGCPYYNHDESVRSVWHGSGGNGELFDEIGKEYLNLKNNETLDRDKFRVNQAVRTDLYGGFEAVATAFRWSLLDMAERTNRKALSHKDFDEWLKVMPIFMVENSDTMKGGFNDKVIEKLNAYNKALV